MGSEDFSDNETSSPLLREPPWIQPDNRRSKKLIVLTRQFMNLLTHNNGKIDILKACAILNVNRRRIYDVINVFEGLGLVEKKHAMLRWRAESLDIKLPLPASLDDHDLAAEHHNETTQVIDSHSTHLLDKKKARKSTPTQNDATKSLQCDEIFDYIGEFDEQHLEMTGHRTIAIQTTCLETRTCGLIGVSMDNNEFTLNCYQCSEEIPISDWKNFIEHVKRQHHPLQHAYMNFDEFVVQRETLNVSNCSNTEIEVKNDINENSNHVDHGGDDEDDDVDAVNDDLEEIEKQLLNQIDPHSSSEDDEDDTNMADKNLIRFGKTDSAIVIDFLDMVKEYPILWNTYKSAKRYRTTVQSIAQQLNERWNLSLTVVGMMKSVNRIKIWYRRIMRNKEEKMNYRIKHPDYFERVSQFIQLPEGTQSLAIVVCSYCERSFKDENLLQAHQYITHKVGELPYKCTMCDKRFINEARVKTHEATHNKMHYCKKCGRSYYREHALKIHMETHKPKMPQSFECETCGKNFTTRGMYKLHKVYHEPPKYKCDICPKSLYTPFMLKEHMKAHLNERDFICEECGMAYVRQKQLMRHKRAVHYKMYACKICDKQFSTANCLNKHLKRFHLVLEGTIEQLEAAKRMRKTKHTYITDPVTNKRRLVCEICGKNYSMHEGLRSHSIKVHGINRLKIAPPKRKQIDMHTTNQSAAVSDDECNEEALYSEVEVAEDSNELATTDVIANSEYLDDFSELTPIEYLIEEVDDPMEDE